MPPMDMPITACRCLSWSVSIARRNSELTMSRMVNCGNSVPCCDALLDGEQETPLPSESTAMTKYFVVSTYDPGLRPAAISPLLPVNQLGNNTAFDLEAFKVPSVR